jgi:hypothetical protein
LLRSVPLSVQISSKHSTTISGNPALLTCIWSTSSTKMQ